MRGGCCPFKKSKPVVWPVGKGYQEYPSKKALQKKRTFLKQKMQTCCLARREGIPGRDWKKWLTKKRFFFVCIFCFKKIFFLSTMVRSGGSNNCSILRIEPWTGRDNRFKVFQRKTYLSFKKYGQKGTLGQVRKLVSLPFHPFSSFFIAFFFLKKKKGRKRQKKAEKGRKRQKKAGTG